MDTDLDTINSSKLMVIYFPRMMSMCSTTILSTTRMNTTLHPQGLKTLYTEDTLGSKLIKSLTQEFNTTSLTSSEISEVLQQSCFR